MSNKIIIHTEDIIKLNDRIQVKTIYRYEDNILGKRDEFRYIFTIENQEWPFGIEVNMKDGTFSTNYMFFDLLHLQDDLKTIFDFISSQKFEKNLFNY